MKLEITELESQKNKAETQVDELQDQMRNIKSRSESINRSLEESRNIARDIEGSAQKKAHGILAEADAAVVAFQQKITQAELEISELKQLEDENRSQANSETKTEIKNKTEQGTINEGNIYPIQLEPVVHLIDQPSAESVPTLTMKLVAFLNARHYMVFQNIKGSVHGHSWQFQVEVEVPMVETSFIKFEDIEKVINHLLEPYQKTILNEVIPFKKIEPLTENLAGYFFTLFDEKFIPAKYRLLKLTVWENPTKGVEVCQRLPAFIFASELLNPGLAQAAASVDDGVENVAAGIEENDIDDMDSDVKIKMSDQSDKMRNSLNSDNGHKGGFLHWIQQSNHGLSDTVVPEQFNYSAWQITLAFLIVIGAAVIAYYPLLTAPLDKVYPWGADTWGHLYKAEFLYQQITQGHFFPQFDANWYNGCQPFRYWAPVPYYTLALINFFTHNIFIAGNYYIFICAVLGALSCLVFSRRTGLWIAVGLAIVWLILPNNLQISFNEGNLPRVLTTAILPLLVMSFMLTVERGKNWWLWLTVVILVDFIILCHAMMGAVYCICLTLLAACMWIFGYCSMTNVFRALMAIIAGIGTSGWWLLPSLKGGLAGMGETAAAGAVQYVSPLISFDPMLRFMARTYTYWGISLLLVIIFTIFMWKNKPGWAKALFCCGLFTLIITFPFFSWLHQLLPLNSLLWPLRFTTFAGFAILFSAFSFKPGLFKELTLKRKYFITGIEVLLLATLLLDSYFSMVLMVTGESKPAQIVSCANEIQKLPGWREATLDLSDIQSAPSYLFSSLSEREQVFGWAWQGAATAENIMLLNTALEREYYPFMFKELLQLGATEVVFKKNLFKNFEKIEELANKYGYIHVSNSTDLSYWHKSCKPYIIQNNNECLAIGKYASVYALQFPSIEMGESNYIDDYNLKTLQKYPVLIVTGASWHFNTKAERLMMDYARSGGKLIVDFTGFPLDVLSRQPKFLGIYAEPIELVGETIINTADKSFKLRPLSKEYKSWRAYIPQGIDGGTVSFNYMGNKAFLLSYKNVGENKIWFLGANPAYHSYLTKDPEIVNILQDLIQIPADYQTPVITPLQNYQINHNGYSMTYQIDKACEATIPIAHLDSWKSSIDGKTVNIQPYENLVAMNLPAGFHTIKLKINNPPVYLWGKILSIISLLLMIIVILIGFINKHSDKKLRKSVDLNNGL